MALAGKRSVGFQLAIGSGIWKVGIMLMPKLSSCSNEMLHDQKTNRKGVLLAAVIRFIPALVMLSFVQSCAIRPDLTAAEVSAARKFTPPKGQGFLYVYRPARVMAAVASIRPVIINGQHLASNSNGTCMVIPLKPGTYQVQAAIQPLTEEQKQSGLYREIPVTIRPGKCSFIRQIVVSNLPTGNMQPLVTLSSGVPLMMSGSTLSGFLAEAVDEQTGRRECGSLEVVGADPYNYNPAPEE